MSESEQLVLDALHPTQWKSTSVISDEITTLKLGEGAVSKGGWFLSTGSIFTALDSLQKKGFASTRFTDPKPEQGRGGRNIREAILTEEGFQQRIALQDNSTVLGGLLSQT